MAAGQLSRIAICENADLTVLRHDGGALLNLKHGDIVPGAIVTIPSCRSATPQPPLSYDLAFNKGALSVGVGTPGPHTSRGSDDTLRLNVELGRLWQPLELDVNLNRQVICPACQGKAGKDDDLLTCPMCHSTGTVSRNSSLGIMHKPHNTGATSPQQIHLNNCPVCDGHGKVVKHGHQCSVCKGARVVQTTSKARVKFPAGVEHGDDYTLRGMGSEKPFQTAGDIKLIVNLVLPDGWGRDGPHLFYKANITLAVSCTRCAEYSRCLADCAVN